MNDSDIKKLIKILEDSSINELEVSTFWGRQKIRLQKNAPMNDQSIEVGNKNSLQVSVDEIIPQTTLPISELDNSSSEPLGINVQEEKEIIPEKTITIKSPLVGTFYISPKPNTPPFITEGDVIKDGQIICIIEAMKIFNEIESEYSGKILKILVEDSTPVEYDQDLLVISSE